MITSAAIRKDGKIYTLPAPARHHHIIHKFKLGQPREDDQGFIDSVHGYVRRAPALKIAIKNNQLLKEPIHPRKLFSEDVW